MLDPRRDRSHSARTPRVLPPYAPSRGHRPGGDRPRGRTLALGTLLLSISLAAPARAVEFIADDALPPNWSAQVVAEGLAGPVAIAPASDGVVYVAERLTGNIRVIDRGRLLPEPIAHLPVVAVGERGLLGLCADPRLVRGPHGVETTLFAYHTPTPDRACIARLRVATARGRAPVLLESTTILDHLPVAGSHNGGALAFGPDRHVYFSIGDLGRPDATRLPESLTGRIHRIAPDGSIPEDNPWPDRSEFCRGLRNCFGLTAEPGVVPVVLYLTDNGTHEGDEVHRAEAGDHLGWPDGVGRLGRPDRVDPIHTWSPTTAPVGITTLDGTLFIEELPADEPAAGGVESVHPGANLLFGEFVSGRVLRLRLDGTGRTVVASGPFIERGGAPVLAVATDRLGHVWFTAGDSVGRARPLGSTWIRGDLDGNGAIDPRDWQMLVAHLDEGAPLPCTAAADIDGDGTIDVADVSRLMQYFQGEIPRLPPPYEFCGEDPTSSEPCLEHPFCG